MNPNPSMQEYFQNISNLRPAFLNFFLFQVKSETDSKIQSTKPDLTTISQPPTQQTPISTKRNCNCKQSKCIKLYCECFNSNVFCDSGCNCVDCLNNDTNQVSKYKETIVDFFLAIQGKGYQIYTQPQSKRVSTEDCQYPYEWKQISWYSD